MLKCSTEILYLRHFFTFECCLFIIIHCLMSHFIYFYTFNFDSFHFVLIKIILSTWISRFESSWNDTKNLFQVFKWNLVTFCHCQLLTETSSSRVWISPSVYFLCSCTFRSTIQHKPLSVLIEKQVLLSHYKSWNSKWDEMWSIKTVHVYIAS